MVLSRAAVLALAYWAVLSLGSPSAGAATVFPPLGEIHEAGCCVESFKSESVGIDDQDGHIYVADSGAHQIRDYASAADASPALWTGEGTPAGRFEGNLAVAVDEGSGDVYVADSGHALIDKFGPDGNLIASFGDSAPTPDGRLRGLSTPAGAFAPAEIGSFGIAVDQASGDFYAIDAGHQVIDVFGPGGGYLRQITATPGELYGLGGAYTDGIAVDDYSGELLVSDSADLRTYRFDLATGAAVGVIDGSEAPAGSFGTRYTSVAADGASGAIYITDTAHEVIDAYEPDGTYSGAQITGTPRGVFGGLGVDQASGDVYVAQGEGQLVRIFGPATVVPDATTLAATTHSTTAATLNGAVDPLGLEVRQCFFEYGPSIAYGQSAPCREPAADELGAGTAPVAVRADLSGLQVGATYHYRLLAAGADGVLASGGDQILFTGATVDATSVSAVGATGATLEALVNPHGLATGYRFEYGPTSAYGTSVPVGGGALGAGTSDVARSEQVDGLAPASTYHLRVVAENALGTVPGPDRTFTTQTIGAGLLPDSRVWELVSPPDKHGVPLGPIGETGPVIQAAADGSGLTYGAVGSIGAGAAGNRATNFSQLLATHGTGGWSSVDISTPHQAPAGLDLGAPSEYQLFAADLSAAAVEPRGATPLSPRASERSVYRREADGSFTPLVDGEDVRAHTTFGGVERSPEGFAGSPGFVTAAPDLSHVLLRSPRALTDEFSPAFEPPYGGEPNIYEWSAGALRLISQIPIGAATSCSGAGCVPAAEAGEAATVGNHSAAMPRAISSDGSRVVFATTPSDRLFLRDVPGGETTELDAAETGCGGCEAGGGTFQGAAADGSRIFFTDPRRLTADSTVSGGAPDLYMCRIEGGPGHLTCALRDLTANTTDPAEPADVQVGAILGAAEDGSVVYFVADGELTGGEGAVHGDCRLGFQAQAAQSCNLYRYDVAAGATHLVAVLSGADIPDWLAEGQDLGRQSARVSPDGRWLAFMSERPLTGYDNRDVASGERDEEVYLYDAAAAGGAGVVHCASCDPTGARPIGVRGPDDLPRTLVDGPDIWRGRWFAANIPGWTSVDLLHALYQSRYLSDSGRLFFNSSDALVPGDSNATEDVYELEPPGVGDCTNSSPSFASSDGGCLGLISSGTSPEESAFLDASSSGDDVFFLTGARLVARDEDAAFDIYDASVGGSEPQVAKASECSGEECQPAAAAPDHATPGTAVTNGRGNIVGCPRTKVRRHGGCVKKHHKNKQAKKRHKKQGQQSKSGRRARGRKQGGTR